MPESEWGFGEGEEAALDLRDLATLVAEVLRREQAPGWQDGYRAAVGIMERQNRRAMQLRREDP